MYYYNDNNGKCFLILSFKTVFVKDYEFVAVRCDSAEVLSIL